MSMPQIPGYYVSDQLSGGTSIFVQLYYPLEPPPYERARSQQPIRTLAEQLCACFPSECRSVRWEEQEEVGLEGKPYQWGRMR